MKEVQTTKASTPEGPLTQIRGKVESSPAPEDNEAVDKEAVVLPRRIKTTHLIVDESGKIDKGKSRRYIAGVTPFHPDKD